MADILEVDSVSCSIGEKKILNDVYLRLQQGKITGLLGRNGSGKSTLLKILFGSFRPEHKSVRYNGNHVLSARKVNGLISCCPQFNFLPGYMNMKEIGLFYQIQSLDKIMDYLDINEKTRVHTLSGGNIRILQVFLCLNMHQKFILLDEPFSQISPVAIEFISEIILKKRYESGILISDHNYRMVTEICDDLYLCHDAAVRAIKPNELENTPYIS